MEHLIRAFEAKYPGHTVSVIWGSSGTLFAQAVQGAPFDVFLSADNYYPGELVRDGTVTQSTPFSYTRGQLALVVRSGTAADFSADGIHTLKNSSVSTIAIANPRSAPYGRAAQETLVHYGLQVQDRIARAESVSQVAHLVNTGAAEAGFVAVSLLPALDTSTEFVWMVPQTAHAPIDQAGNRTVAERFQSFLCSDDGQGLLSEHGYLNPAAPDARSFGPSAEIETP